MGTATETWADAGVSPLVSVGGGRNGTKMNSKLNGKLELDQHMVSASRFLLFSKCKGVILCKRKHESGMYVSMQRRSRMDERKIVICDPPIETKRYEFLYDHLDCDCIVDKSKEKETKTIRIIAYSPAKENNPILREYFRLQKFHGKYKILQGIDSKEVFSIDECRVS